MQTTVEIPVAGPATFPNAQVAQYLETLQREQERYLHAVGCARAVLDDRSHLAQMSAVQGRLVRRFFDAQRAILEQRARVDDDFRAFLTADVDGARYMRQLDALLDEWWSAERRETSLVPTGTAEENDDDRFQDLEASFGENVPADGVVAGRLPASLVDALDGAGSHDLDRLLDDLVADLDAHLAVAAAAAPLPVAVAVPAVQPGDLMILSSADDGARFDSFWPQPSSPGALEVLPAPASAHDWSWIPTQVVVPIVAVTAGLSLALLLIG